MSAHKVSFVKRWLHRLLNKVDISRGFRWYYRKGYREGVKKERIKHPPILHGAFCMLHIPPIMPDLVEPGVFRCPQCLRQEHERVTDKHTWIQQERKRIVDKRGRPDTQQMESIRIKNMSYHLGQKGNNHDV